MRMECQEVAWSQMRSFDAVYCIGVPRVTEFQTDAEIEAS